MAEQTHGNKQIRAEEKYMEELKESDAYMLLKYACDHPNLLTYYCYSMDFQKVVYKFINTGIRDRSYDVR